MSKALVISRVFPPRVGGSGRFLWEIYRRQPGNQYCVAAGHCRDEQSLKNDERLAIYRMPLDVANWGLLPLGFPSYIANYLRLQKIVRRERAAALHAATILPEGFLAWMLHRTAGLPYLCYIHGEEIPIVQGSRELSWMARRVLDSAERIIANSQNTRHHILKHWPACAEKVAVLTPGVDVLRFRPVAANDEIRAKLDWTKRRVVMTAGRLQQRKGHDRLIEALPIVRRSLPNIRFTIVGDGSLRADLESLAESLGVGDCVQFLGELSDRELVECYQQCDVFALPNREVDGDFEGFGMVLVEAQACGKPVLAGISGGTPETLVPGKTGRLVCCDEVEPLASTLIEMLSNPAALERMGACAREWAVNQFDWNSLAVKAANLFAHIGAGRSGASDNVLVAPDQRLHEVA